MGLHTALAVAASLVGLAFAMSTFERWLARRRRHDLAWSISLLQFSLAAAALAAGAATGWSGPLFRTFFLFGAILNVPWLALGSAYLLFGQRRVDPWAAGIALLSAFATGVLVVAPFTAPLPTDELARGSEVFGPLPRILAAACSALGALVVFGGAAWSAVRFWRASLRMVIANALLALGTLILSSSGLLNSVVGEMTGFSLTLTLGISVLFAGFLVASAAPRPNVARPGLPSPSASAAPGAGASPPDRAAAPRRT